MPRFSLFTTLLSLMFSQTLFAAPSVNLLEVVQNYFPQYSGEEQFLIANASCSFSLKVENHSLTMALTQGERFVQWNSASLLAKETRLVEKEGRAKNEGYYSYGSFYSFASTTVITKGLFYYTPSLDNADSSEDILQEQKVTFEKTLQGVTLTFKERAPQRPQHIICAF